MGTTRALLTTAFVLTIVVSGVFAEETVHVLQRGETIYTLSREYRISADAILEYNDIVDPTRLAVGTRIRIPGTYIVQRGEYIYSIARKLGVDWLDLLAANGLSKDDVVRPGDTLLIPGRAAAQVAARENTTSSGSIGDEQTVQTQTTGTTTGENSDRGATQSDATDASTPGGAKPLPVRADPTTPVEWPHAGTREKWDGKFPGVVMQGAVGDLFRSVASGVVEYVGPFSSFGKLVLVRGSNGFLYGYAGADRIDVAKGDRVNSGTVLGTVGFSSAFESAKVLFTVWRNNRYVDPETAPRG